MQWVPSEKKEQPEEGDYIEVTGRWGKRFVEILDPIKGNGDIVRFYFDPPQPEQGPVAYMGNGIMSPASVLEMTRNAFGLNVSDLADVLQTTRQTVYQWMKLSDMEQVRSHAHLERIKVVYRATQFWNEQPILKGRWSKAILPTGGTVLDILKANEIDLDTLKAAHAVLSGSSAQPEQEPVAWRTFDGEGNYDFLEYEANESYRDDYIKCNGTKYASWVDPLYTHPPKRKWQSLTDDEIKEIIGSYSGPIKGYTRELFDKIEAKLKEKNA